MARCLNTYRWADESLNRQVLHNADDIIVEDSDVDESPHTKAERNRRREAIGQRYVLGHIPLIQSASLRGPFGRDSGWAAPWAHHKARPQIKRPFVSIRNHATKANDRRARDAASETLLSEKSAGQPVKEESIEKQKHDDVVHYDADNKNDAFEDMDEEGRCLLLHDDFRAQITGNVSGVSESDLQQSSNYNCAKDPGRIRKPFSPRKLKRKVDTSWLKEANVLKRSRHGFLEHLSPTPVAGAIRKDKTTLGGGPCLQLPQIKTSNGQKTSQALPALDINDDVVQIEATDETSTLPSLFMADDEFSRQVTDESDADFLMSDRQRVPIDNEDSTNSFVTEQIIKEKSQISQYRPLLTQPSRQRHFEDAQLSPSDLDVTNNRLSSSAGRLARQGTRSVSLKGDIQGSKVETPGLSTPSDGIADNGTILSRSDGKVDLLDTHSPASEDSFQYRKRSRKRVLSPTFQRSKEGKSAAEGDISAQKRGDQNLRLASPNVPRLSNSMFCTNTTSLEVQTNPVNYYTKTDEKRQHRTTSPIENLGALRSVVSSPDPLSEDFKDSREQRTTSMMRQESGQNLINLSKDQIAAEYYERTMVTRDIPSSNEQAGGMHQFVLRDLPQLSTTNVLGYDHIEIPTGSVRSIQRQISDSHTKRAVLLDKGDDVEEAVVAGGSRRESPEAEKTSTASPNSLQQPDALVTQMITFRGSTEPSRHPKLDQQVDSLPKSTPPRVDAEVLEKLAKPTQSPWIPISVESPRPGLSSDLESISSECRTDDSFPRHHLRGLPNDEVESVAFLSEVQDNAITHGGDSDEAESFRAFQSVYERPGHFSDELGQSPPRFPSTQTLVDAATANPWNSAFKNPRSHKLDKQVSFGPLPSEEVSGSASDASAKSLVRMGSPPPPVGTLRLTQLDDPFHYRLKATRGLEVTEESLTKFMNTPWNEIPPIKQHANPPPGGSPAVAAMAEAFIVADQQSLHEKIGVEKRSISARTTIRENMTPPRMETVDEQIELSGSSSPDVSFSIAPNGRVTAVSIESPGYDAEDNLHAVIKDMGSFLEGWDVESELKKAKGNKSERSNELKAPRKREYLSGISNR